MFIIYHPRATFVRSIARDLRQSVRFPDFPTRNVTRRGQMNVIVNWGCGPQMLARTPGMRLSTQRILNADISTSIRKVRTFDALRAANLPIPRVVADPQIVLSDNSRPFYQRGKYLARQDGLTGGAGITIYEAGQLPAEGASADFYSQVVAKAHEVRIHVAGGRVICEQIKHIPAGSGVLIRNWDNGARFSARNIEAQVGAENATRAREIAIAATTACGLDFGALDMALTRNGQWVIFEINSAPGITKRDDDGTIPHDMPCTYEAYREFFRSFIVGNTHA